MSLTRRDPKPYYTPSDFTFTERNATQRAERLARKRYNMQNDIKAAHIATMVRPENTRWIIERLRKEYGTFDGRERTAHTQPTLKDMTVIEIGAGLGYLAVEMAKVCKHVFAIETDPMFSHEFAQKLYAEKPANLTWIFDTARPAMSRMCGGWLPAGDLVLVVTGSDEVRLRKLAETFLHPVWGE